MKTTFPRAHGRLLATTLLFAAALPAQQPVPLPATTSPIAVSPDHGHGSGGIWAAGADWKASFHDGMTFYPDVGADLSHQPLRWRTRSVRIGDRELIDAAAATPRHRGSRCDYDLGGCIERYDVRDNGLEQSFLFATRPGSGDLVIEGAIDTTLRLPETAPQHGDLDLRLPDGRPLIRYGRAFAIDAAGVTTPVDTACDGRTITLRVAAEVVAQARFPLVIDPLLANVGLTAGRLATDVDVLHETLTAAGLQARTWFAVSNIAAAGDSDLRLYRCGSGFGGTPVEVYREISLWDSTHGRLALAPASSHVVLVHATDIGGDRMVIVHRHHVTDISLSTAGVIVPSTLAEHDWRPDVGGRVGPDGSRVLITFQRELGATFANTATSAVFACVYDASIEPTLFGFVVAPFPLLVRANADQERCVVNQAASSNQWLVAFQEHNGAVFNDDWDITTVAVDGNGVAAPTGLDTTPAGDPLRHKIAPQLAGTFGRYELTYTLRQFELADPKPSSVLGDSVQGQRLDWSHATGNGSLPHPAVLLQATAGNALENGGLAFDTVSRSHWCALVGNRAGDSLRVHKLGYRGAIVESAPVALPAGTEPAACATTFSAEGRAFPIVFSRDAGTVGGNAVLGTQSTYGNLAAPTAIDFACGSGVFTGLGATADRQQIGSQAMPLMLGNAPQDTFAFLLLSTGLGNTPGSTVGAPGCTIVPDVFSPAYVGAIGTTIAGGTAMVTLDLPENLAPMPLFCQWAYVVPGANGLGMLASAGLRIGLDR